MSWRDDLSKVTLGSRILIGASFRGVPFFVESSDRSGGRRTVTHEFPLRDDPYVEDLGRRARVFRVDGYVLGDDYVAERNALLAALEDTAGPGELVHPYHGVRRAISTGHSVRETIADGGMAIFAIEFAEAPAQVVVPSETADAAGQVDAAATTAIAATEAEFASSYDVDGQPSFALERVSQALVTASSAVGLALAPIVLIEQEAAQLNVRIQLLVAEASSLVREPADVLGAFRDALLGLADTMLSAPGAVAAALVAAYRFDAGSSAPETTATRRRERANQLALVAALRRVLAIEAGRLLPLATFDTHEEAIAARETVLALLDEQAELAGDDAYAGIVELRAKVGQAVPGDPALARVLSLSQRTTVPSLVLSYRLYGSVDQESDILARNRIRHPGFVAGELQVLSHG